MYLEGDARKYCDTLFRDTEICIKAQARECKKLVFKDTEDKDRSQGCCGLPR